MMFPKPTSMYIAVTLACNTNGFTVAPPAVPANQIVVESPSSLSSSSIQTFSSSNLPSHQQLLDKVGSSSTLTLASAAPTASTATTTTTAAQPTATKATTTTKTANANPATTNNVASTAAKTKTATISIASINYDGIVPKTEADEYVTIQNNSNQPVDVTNYIIYPATTGTQGSTFKFPKGSIIKANSSVRVYTNEVHKESGGYSWGSGKALWSNNGGLGVIKDGSGKKLGEFKYVPAPSSSSASKK